VVLALSILNTPETIQAGFKVDASFCILVRAPFIEFLSKLVVVFCAYDVATIPNGGVANDIIATANTRPMIIFFAYIIASNYENMCFI
jgi:hypothetical protein